MALTTGQLLKNSQGTMVLIVTNTRRQIPDTATLNALTLNHGGALLATVSDAVFNSVPAGAAFATLAAFIAANASISALVQRSGNGMISRTGFSNFPGGMAAIMFAMEALYADAMANPANWKKPTQTAKQPGVPPAVVNAAIKLLTDQINALIKAALAQLSVDPPDNSDEDVDTAVDDTVTGVAAGPDDKTDKETEKDTEKEDAKDDQEIQQAKDDKDNADKADQEAKDEKDNPDKTEKDDKDKTDKDDPDKTEKDDKDKTDKDDPDKTEKDDKDKTDKDDPDKTGKDDKDGKDGKDGKDEPDKTAKDDKDEKDADKPDDEGGDGGGGGEEFLKSPAKIAKPARAGVAKDVRPSSEGEPSSVWTRASV